MAQEKIKLSIEKHGDKIRYRKMVKGQVWISGVFASDSRESRREAWQAFKIWRSALVIPEASKIAPDDPHKEVRGRVAKKVSGLLAHSELTSGHDETKVFRDLVQQLPQMEVTHLYQLAALIDGEYNGKRYSPIIDDRIQIAERMKDEINPDLTAMKLTESYVSKLRRKANSGNGSWGHYHQTKRALDVFVEWYGSENDLSKLSDKTIRDFTEHLESKMDAGEISTNTASQYQKVWRSWLTYITENYSEIPVPRNLRSKTQKIKGERKEPSPFTVDEVNMILGAATPRTKLLLLLMLNCGMYQGDIADLEADEIDWKNGRIVRPRNKTARFALRNGKDQPPKTNWLLWKETWKLFQQFANTEGICIKTQNGELLVTHKESTRNDAVRSSFRRVIDKLKRNGKLPKAWNKTLKQFRKTGANLLQKSKEHGTAYKDYLSHSVAQRNYLTSGEPVPEFDKAITWLGKQFKLD